MNDSIPSHPHGLLLLWNGFPFFYVRWGARKSGTQIERGAPAAGNFLRGSAGEKEGPPYSSLLKLGEKGLVKNY